VERESISRRTKEGLKAAREKGVRLGRPAENRGAVAEVATQLRGQGLTLQEVADNLNARGYRTARGANFAPTTVFRMVNRMDPTVNPEGGYQVMRVEAL
jgi:DNA invertase Pin-like site-specific DNA recombinase